MSLPHHPRRGWLYAYRQPRPTQWSVINANGPGMMVESFDTGALAALSAVCDLPYIGTFSQVGGLATAGTGNGRCSATLTARGATGNFFCYDP